MWFAIAFIGIIAAATGITLLPGGAPQDPSPPAAAAPGSPATPAPPAGSTR